MMTCSIHVLILMIGAAPSLTLSEVAEANEASIGGIRSLVIRVRCFQASPPGDPLVETENYVYRTQESEERLTLSRVGLPANENGDNMGYSDTYNGSAGMKSIVGYDPDRPPKLGENSLSGAQGNLAPRDTGARRLTSIPRNQLLFDIAYSKEAWSLRELVAKSSSRLLAAPTSSPRHCYEIEAKRPNVGFHISVDPAANFMIRRLEIIPAATAKAKVSVVIEVKEFQDRGEGAFIPTVIEGEMVEEESARTTRIRRECEVLSCNQALPAEDFAVAFPDWLRVVDQRSGKIHYWGSDDKPRLTFDTAEDHRRWWTPRRDKAMRARYVKPFPWSWVMGGVTIALAVALVVRSRIRARLLAT